MRNFSPVSEMTKGQRSWGRIMEPNSRNKANIAKHKNYREWIRVFHSFGTLIAVSLQLIGKLIMWKIQQAMQDDAVQAARILPAFIPVTELKCSSGKNFVWTNEKFYKEFRGKARSRKTGPAQSTGLMWSGPENLFCSLKCARVVELLIVTVTMMSSWK